MGSKPIIREPKNKNDPKVYYYSYEDVDEALDRYILFKKETEKKKNLVMENYKFKTKMFKDADGIYTIEIKVWKKLLKD